MKSLPPAAPPPPRTSLAHLQTLDARSLRAPCPRLPVAVVLDTSESMRGAPMEELRQALDLFLDTVATDLDARDACDVAFVSVGGKVEVLRPLVVAHAGGLVEEARAGGDTPLGKGVELALDLLEARRAQHLERGTPCFRPWLVLLTDGQPSDDTRRAEARVGEELRQGRLTVMPLGIGPKADLLRLEALAGGTRPQRLAGLSFRAFFRWLSASMATVSRSVPGEKVALPSPFEWVQT